MATFAKLLLECCNREGSQSSHSSSSPSFPSSLSSTGSVSWSTDDRLSVVSNDIIYILTLTFSHQTVRPTAPISVTVIEAPPFSPLVSQTPSFDLSSILYGKAKEGEEKGEESSVYDILFDPLINGSGSRGRFVSAKWSPDKSSLTNRCVLACLTSCGRVLIYHEAMRGHWEKVLDVSIIYHQLLLAVNYDVEKLCLPSVPPTASSTAPPTALPTAFPTASSAAPPTAPLTVPPTASPTASSTAPSTASSTASTIVPPTVSPAAPPTNLQNDVSLPVYRRQQSLLVAVAMSWLPVLLEKEAILAVAMKSCCVTVWSMKVPLDSSFTPSLLRLYHLPEGSGCVTALEWTIINGHSYLLSIGTSNGMVILLEWVEPKFSLWNPIMHQLCSTSDGFPVSHMAWSHSEVTGNSKKWLVFSKGPYLFAIKIVCRTRWSQVSFSIPYLLSSTHALPISGITGLHNNDIISCSMDGSINCRSLPEKRKRKREEEAVGCESNFVHADEDVKPLLLGSKFTTSSLFCFGLASSINSLYTVVHIKMASKKSTQLLILPLIPQGDVKLLDERTISWDLYEYMRNNLSVMHRKRVITVIGTLPLMIQRIAASLKNESDKVLKIEEELLAQHCRLYLSKLLNWTKKNEIVNREQALISISNSSALLSLQVNHSVQELVDKSLSLFAGSQSPGESCPICNEVIPYVTCHNGTCSNGHSWRRCVLTQCIVTLPSETLSCSFCHKPVISFREGWLRHVLDTFHSCPICGGHFEPSL